MDSSSGQICLVRNGEGLVAQINGTRRPVDRIARAFPESNPHHFISLLDPTGHEIGMIRDLDALDTASQDLVQEELDRIYLVPTILEILSVEQNGAGRVLTVRTDGGDTTFEIMDRNALDGKLAPAITMKDKTGKRYRIRNYWDLNKTSRKSIQDILPLKVIKTRRANRIF